MPQDKKNTKPDLKEIGNGLDQSNGSYEDIFSDQKIKAREYAEMFKKDGTANAMYNILTMPILSNTFTFTPHPDDNLIVNGKITHPQAEFITDCLTRPPHEGGMTTPLSLVLDEMLTALIYGYKLFEIVWQIDDNGNIVPKKLASRDNETLKIKRNETGGFDGVEQSILINNQSKTVTIPVEKCFIFTVNKGYDSIEGKSVFTSAFHHWNLKRKAYFLANQQLQVGAMGYRVVTAPKTADAATREAQLRKIDKLTTRPSIVLPEGWTLDIKGMPNTIDAMPLIEHHNTQMALSILGQFLMLGSSGGGGSYALSENHSDLYIMALKGVMNNISEHLTYYFINKIVAFNFENPLVPTFTFNDLTETETKEIANVFNKIVEKSPESLDTWFKEGIINKTADNLGVVKPTEENKPTKKSFSNDFLWRRDLTEAEKTINLRAINTMFINYEQEFINRVTPITDKIQENAINQITKIVEKKDIAELKKFKVKTDPEYIAKMKEIMADVYTKSKVIASDDLEVPAPQTSEGAKQYIQQQAELVANKQTEDLNFKIQEEVLKALKNNQIEGYSLSDESNFIIYLTGVVRDFFTKTLTNASNALISEVVNISRDDVFTRFNTKISSYQYSAILDNKTCPICEKLDGSVVEYKAYKATEYQPPIHSNCRCIWIAIKEEQTVQPDITGIPVIAS